MTNSISRDDLRAAVSSGIIDETQAVKLQTLSDTRMGYRAHMIGDDEPFELFKGFAEIFVTVGICLLISGFVGLSFAFGDHLLLPVTTLVLSFTMALYFTKKRRMTLPSIALCLFFGGSVAVMGVALFFDGWIGPTETELVAIGLMGIAAMIVYYRIFRLPFAMFMIGMFGLLTIFAVMLTMDHTVLDATDDIEDIFDLRGNTTVAIGMLVFGVLAFLGALYFDMKDPHRVSRHASTAFWLHILAAPALVNTLVMSNYLMGGTGTLIAIIVLTIFTLLAIIIDRRSFLTAGLIYMGLLLAQVINETGTNWGPVITTLLLGVFVTALGAYWTQVRTFLMGVLPDFPGKGRLPPFAAGLPSNE